MVEALIGSVCLVQRVEDATSCPRAEYCECRVVYQLINEWIDGVLGKPVDRETLLTVLRHLPSRAEAIGEGS